MTARGVHFALPAAAERRLLAASDDDEVMEAIEEIEEAWEEPYVAESDKAWDVLHRCLSDGTLHLDGGTYPLSHAILGGRQLYEGEDYYVCYVSAAQVQEIAVALAAVTKEWLRQRYDALGATDYDGPHSDDDFDYTWDGLLNVRKLYSVAAKEGRAVIFTVDQ